MVKKNCDDRGFLDNVNDLMSLVESMVEGYELSVYDKIVKVLKTDSHYPKDKK
jgi:hypothetical protein